MEVEAGAYFKKGDVLISTLGNPFIYNGIINREGDMGCIYGISAYGEITSEEVPIWTSVCGEDKSKYVRLATEEEKKSFAESNAFKIESRFLTGSYEQFWIIKESVCPAIKGEAGYSKEEFDKVNKENEDPELESINSFNNTLKNANEIKDRVLKYVYNIKQERSYNNDLVGIFERYKDIADGDMEVAMNFIKEAYPFNEETEVFIRKKFDMFIPVPIPDELK